MFTRDISQGSKTGICKQIGRAWSRVKAQVEAETDERAGLHQEDGRQRSS